VIPEGPNDGFTLAVIYGVEFDVNSGVFSCPNGMQIGRDPGCQYRIAAD
jgi:hypothetical protein